MKNYLINNSKIKLINDYVDVMVNVVFTGANFK